MRVIGWHCDGQIEAWSDLDVQKVKAKRDKEENGLKGDQAKYFTKFAFSSHDISRSIEDYPRVSEKNAWACIKQSVRSG